MLRSARDVGLHQVVASTSKQRKHDNCCEAYQELLRGGPNKQHATTGAFLISSVGEGVAVVANVLEPIRLRQRDGLHVDQPEQ